MILATIRLLPRIFIPNAIQNQSLISAESFSRLVPPPTRLDRFVDFATRSSESRTTDERRSPALVAQLLVDPERQLPQPIGRLAQHLQALVLLPHHPLRGNAWKAAREDAKYIKARKRPVVGRERW